MKIAIIGCGYVGTEIAKRWKQAGHQVTATTTTPSRVNELAEIVDEVRIVRGDDPETVRSLLESQEVLLLSVGARGGDYETAYLTTAKTIAAILPQCPKLRHVIYTSSFAVYGDRQGDWVTEETPAKPGSKNHEILLDAEQVLLEASSPDRAICVLRLGGIYGPGRELARIFQRAAGKTRPGSGQEASNWIHLDDIVGAIAFAQTHRLQGLYNLVQDNPTTVRDLIDRVCQTHNFAAVTWDESQPSSRVHNVRVSNQKLKSAGYRFQQSDFLI